MCQAGACVEALGCTLPPLSAVANNPQVNALSLLRLLPEGRGCDLDGDGVVNNVLGRMLGIYAAVNDRLDAAVAAGELAWLLVPSAWPEDGAPFSVDVLPARLAAGSQGCDPGVACGCAYLIEPEGFRFHGERGDQCLPKAGFDLARRDGPNLSATATRVFPPVVVPIVGIEVPVRLRRARLAGHVDSGAGWTSTDDGVLCGVYLQRDLHDWLDKSFAAELERTGFGLETIKELLAGVWVPDIDTDGDGVLDGLSVAFRVETRAARVVGWAD